MIQTIHVIPVGGTEPLHAASGDCWCSPLQKASDLYIHHAKDNRERWERKGIIDQDAPWVLVYSPARR